LARFTLVAFAAATLLAPLGSFASATTPASDFWPATAQVSAVGETGTDDAVKDADPDDDQGNSPAMTLAVNGRVVATAEQPLSVTANKWNWTLLLLGCAGLVVAQLTRRRPRRGMISYR
jgi:hypothetical protein